MTDVKYKVKDEIFETYPEAIARSQEINCPVETIYEEETFYKK